jgi:hypothetical protein
MADNLVTTRDAVAAKARDPGNHREVGRDHFRLALFVDASIQVQKMKRKEKETPCRIAFEASKRALPLLFTPTHVSRVQNSRLIACFP